MVSKFCIHKAKKNLFISCFELQICQNQPSQSRPGPWRLSSKPVSLATLAAAHTYTHTHKHKLSWHNYVTQTSADYLNVCWRCHPQCAHGGWVVSHLRSGTGETDPPPSPTRTHRTLPWRSNPGAAYACVYFSTCVLACYLWWVGLKQISTPLVQFKRTGTILHTTAQLMRDKPEPRKVSDDTSTWLKTESLAFPLSPSLSHHACI